MTATPSKISFCVTFCAFISTRFYSFNGLPNNFGNAILTNFVSAVAGGAAKALIHGPITYLLICTGRAENVFEILNLTILKIGI